MSEINLIPLQFAIHSYIPFGRSGLLPAGWTMADASLCGQCVGVCPTGALKSKREFLLERDLTPDQVSVMRPGRKKRK